MGAYMVVAWFTLAAFGAALFAWWILLLLWQLYGRWRRG